MAYTTIDNPELYFQTKLYTGNGTAIGSGGLTVTFDGSENMQPDLVWIKNRDGIDWHDLFDSVRGVTKRLYSNSTNAENTNTEGLTAFGTNGFTVGNSGDVNTNSNNHASWNWLAGGTGSSNTDGSITSTVSANTTAGFSIVSYTGTGSAATVGHGLGSELACYIIKQRDATGGWIVYHKGNTSSPETDYLRLDKTDATVDDAIFNDTAPTSSVFSIGTNAPVNTSSGTYIAYCFAEKKGYSKFGSYVGNGSSDGPFIFTGFKPAWIMIKRTDTTGSWYILDNKRNTFNVVTKYLKANETTADSTIDFVDFTANGVKMKATGPDVNTSGATHIFMAFAESPFVTSTGIPTTAR